MADLSSMIAQFGQNAGSGIAAGVQRGLQRGERNRLLDLQQQASKDEAEQKRKAEFLKGQSEYTVRGIEALASATPENRPLVWQGFLQGAAERGYDTNGEPAEWNERYLPVLMGKAGVEAPTPNKQQGPQTQLAKLYADRDRLPQDDPRRAQYDQIIASLIEGKPDEQQGAFAGTGIEAQMLNVVLDPSIPDTDPVKILARQRLEKETTTVTPDGTYIRPGYDLAQLSAQPQPQLQPTGNAPAPQSESRTQFVEKPATDGEKLSAGFYDRMVNAQSELDNLFTESPAFDPASTGEAVKGQSNYTASSEYQRYKQAANDWIRAKLRKESGAVIGPEEMLQEYETYFPIPGDKPDVIEQKARARKLAESAMRRSAGRAVPDEASTADTIDWSDLPDA